VRFDPSTKEGPGAKRAAFFVEAANPASQEAPARATRPEVGGTAIGVGDFEMLILQGWSAGGALRP